MVKHMLMMGKELHKKMEMCAMNAYVMFWGSDYIPSDADSEGSLKWFSKTERRILLLHIMLAEGSSIENILDSISTQALLHSFTVMMKQYYIGKF